MTYLFEKNERVDLDLEEGLHTGHEQGFRNIQPAHHNKDMCPDFKPLQGVMRLQIGENAREGLLHRANLVQDGL